MNLEETRWPAHAAQEGLQQRLWMDPYILSSLASLQLSEVVSPQQWLLQHWQVLSLWWVLKPQLTVAVYRPCLGNSHRSKNDLKGAYIYDGGPSLGAQSTAYALRSARGTTYRGGAYVQRRDEIEGNAG